MPGVFEELPSAGIVNGSLWTIPYELECYILISLVAVAGVFVHRSRVLPIFVLLTVGLAAWNRWHGIHGSPPGGVEGRILILCFLAGIVLNAYKDRIAWRWEFALASFVLAMWTTRGYTAVYLSPVFSAYLTVYLGMLNPKRSVIVNSGDYSYGTYLYAGPIQQTVVALIGTVGGWAANVAIALPLTILFALFSWWCVEKPLLAFRARIVRVRLDAAPRLPAPDHGRIDSPQRAS